MQGFGSLALQCSSHAMWTITAPWLETSPSVGLCSSSSMLHSLMFATGVALATSQARIFLCARSQGRESW